MHVLASGRNRANDARAGQLNLVPALERGAWSVQLQEHF